VIIDENCKVQIAKEDRLIMAVLFRTVSTLFVAYLDATDKINKFIKVP